MILMLSILVCLFFIVAGAIYLQYSKTYNYKMRKAVEVIVDISFTLAFILILTSLILFAKPIKGEVVEVENYNVVMLSINKNYNYQLDITYITKDKDVIKHSTKYQLKFIEENIIPYIECTLYNHSMSFWWRAKSIEEYTLYISQSEYNKLINEQGTHVYQIAF